jgi:hypothetical protein
MAEGTGMGANTAFGTAGGSGTQDDASRSAEGSPSPMDDDSA